MKRFIFPAIFTALMIGVGAVGGVVYPYTELIFDNDLNQSQRSDHIDTMMIDNAELTKDRAWAGAVYGGGMSLVVLGMGAYRRQRHGVGQTRPMSQRNAIQRWLDKSEHNHPGGRTGEMSDPFLLGSLSVPSGVLMVVDYWTMRADESIRIPTRSGTHHVYATGIEIEGARRVAAMWMHHQSADPMTLETMHAGVIPIDSWGIAMGDLEPWLRDLSEEEDKQLGELVFGQYADGCERYELAVGTKRHPLFRSFTGRGSGVYDVYRMQSRGTSVGAYVEFLWPEDKTA